MIGLSWDSVRLFVHVLAATVWVGGQLTLAALVPALRGFGAEVPRAAARAFNRIAWPAFGVLILTGIWNVSAERDHDHGAYRVTLVVKLVVVALSGWTAWMHARARNHIALAAYGVATSVSALVAVLFGILLAG